MRRRPGLLQAEYAAACRWDERSLGQAPEQGGGTPAQRRLETHLWAAKRLSMCRR
jgi:hypothetical protein